MSDDSNALQQLTQKDSRYKVGAYLFVREALDYAADALEMGSLTEPEPSLTLDEKTQQHRERHLTGQQLCDGIRLYAVVQFGLMAKIVLSEWGVTCTSHFGDIVYNMIEAGLLSKSPMDRRSDFDDAYDFEEVFNRNFRICNSVGNPVNFKDSLGSGQEF